MKGNEALLAVLAALEQLDVPYMVTGSFATNVYSIPRSTKDADVIVEAESEQIFELLDALPPGLKADGQMLFETVTASKRWLISVEGSAFMIELFLLNSHAFDRSRFDRRRRLGLVPEVAAFVPTAEDVVVQKLRWVARVNRDKDFNDAVGVIRTQGEKLDWPYIEKWCAELGASDALAEARRMAEA
jgi:hypothetical protein